jgi:hypothetical protein
MKRLFLSLIYLFIIGSIFSQEFDFEKISKFYYDNGIALRIPNSMIQAKPVVQEDASYELAYLVEEQPGYELRIGLYNFGFLQNLENSDSQEIKKLIIPFGYTIILNVSGNGDIPMDAIVVFPEWAVKEEFNGDYGITLKFEADSNFSAGYSLIMFSMFYKKGKGMCVVYHLFKDYDTYDKMIKSKNFQKYYDCFMYL